MENREEFLSEVLIRVQRNYVHMVEIERLTKDMADSLSRNDKESVELLLKMRGEEMDQVSTAKHEIQTILEALDLEDSSGGDGVRGAGWDGAGGGANRLVCDGR